MTVDLPPERLDQLLTGQLILQAQQVTWLGRLHSPAQLQALRALSQQGDAPFREAITRLVTALETLETTAALSAPLPTRPQPSQLPPALQPVLLIGRARIRYHGLMTVQEGQDLRALFDTAPDKQAVTDLFEAAANRGLQGSELRLRARRGSAAPSDLLPLSPRSLDESSN
ncbi:hypothetical protein XM38_019150 [Halomicronema hongdechloris C2206]|uniref:Uncharacterized protein n=1 Tax=Halomicronema hongdechloris C2206 TaxID=1641165 RepID=A0A1Z3HL11_9CYAN|nr:hypothetical protein [Halomicronema hongdechloris]ASC70966.1 hypothetical protein XM38_019150 [Halomicronema hongdechloris C2206]